MAKYFDTSAYTPVNTLTGSETWQIYQTATTHTVTLQDVLDDLVQPLISASTNKRLIDTTFVGVHTITESDLGNRLVFAVTGATNVTLPQDTTEAIADGFQCVVRLTGTGSITFVKEGTDVIYSPDGLVAITKRYGEVVVTKSASGVWELNGELA